MKKLTLLLAAGALAIPAAAAAQPGPRAPQGDVTLAQMQQRSAEMFAKLDADGDGRVTTAEMAAQRQDRRDARFARVDANGDGALSKAEIEAARDQRQAKRAENGKGERMGKRGGGKRGAMMRGGLQRLDANGDGTVTLAEFQAPQVERFRRADANGDGTVTQAERQAAREAMREQRQARRGNR